MKNLSVHVINHHVGCDIWMAIIRLKRNNYGVAEWQISDTSTIDWEKRRKEDKDCRHSVRIPDVAGMMKKTNKKSTFLFLADHLLDLPFPPANPDEWAGSSRRFLFENPAIAPESIQSEQSNHLGDSLSLSFFLFLFFFKMEKILSLIGRDRRRCSAVFPTRYPSKEAPRAVPSFSISLLAYLLDNCRSFLLHSVFPSLNNSMRVNVVWFFLYTLTCLRIATATATACGGVGA